MTDEDQYIPRQGDMVIFDRQPVEEGQRRAFRVASHDARTGMTTFARLPRTLSAHEMTELGARRVRVVPPSELEPDWEGAGRRLATVGAGHKPKIHQLASLGGCARGGNSCARFRGRVACFCRQFRSAGRPAGHR